MIHNQRALREMNDKETKHFIMISGKLKGNSNAALPLQKLSSFNSMR
jgi:hypothetical protein